MKIFLHLKMLSLVTTVSCMYLNNPQTHAAVESAFMQWKVSVMVLTGIRMHNLQEKSTAVTNVVTCP